MSRTGARGTDLRAAHRDRGKHRDSKQDAERDGSDEEAPAHHAPWTSGVLEMSGVVEVTVVVGEVSTVGEPE
jgi:hypothetical protein